MGKKKENEKTEWMRIGNFTVYGNTDGDGHTYSADIVSASGDWVMRVDESTWSFGMLRTLLGMKDGDDKKLWSDYYHSILSVVFRFGTEGIPVEVLVDLDKAITKHMDKLVEEGEKSHTEAMDKEAIAEARNEIEMRDELKKVENDEKQV